MLKGPTRVWPWPRSLHLPAIPPKSPCSGPVRVWLDSGTGWRRCSITPSATPVRRRRISRPWSACSLTATAPSGGGASERPADALPSRETPAPCRGGSPWNPTVPRNCFPQLFSRNDSPQLFNTTIQTEDFKSNRLNTGAQARLFGEAFQIQPFRFNLSNSAFRAQSPRLNRSSAAIPAQVFNRSKLR